VSNQIVIGLTVKNPGPTTVKDILAILNPLGQEHHDFFSQGGDAEIVFRPCSWSFDLLQRVIKVHRELCSLSTVCSTRFLPDLTLKETSPAST